MVLSTEWSFFRNFGFGAENPLSLLILLAGKFETFSIECVRPKRLITDRVQYKRLGEPGLSG